MVGGLQVMKGFLEVFGQRDPKSPLAWNLSTAVQQLIPSFIIVRAFLASFTTGFLGHFRRRYFLVVGSVLCWISGAIMAWHVLYLPPSAARRFRFPPPELESSQLESLLGRIILGLSNGLYFTFT